MTYDLRYLYVFLEGGGKFEKVMPKQTIPYIFYSLQYYVYIGFY